MNRKSHFLAIAASVSLLASTALQAQPTEIDREFRSIWLTTVFGLDWPASGDSSATQRTKLLALLDTAESLNMNSVLFQVRGECDAMYVSDLEPWSRTLTGTSGTAKVPSYDPLQLVIDESRRRGMEVQAWFNPFRAGTSASASFHSSHIVNHPTYGLNGSSPWVTQYGTTLYLDPGIPEVQDYVFSVIEDVATRYDIDGVHFDDYFYPYPRSGSITDISRTGTTTTVTTSSSHSLHVGAVIQITGAGASLNISTATITSVPDTTTFVFTHTTSGTNSNSSGTWSQLFDDNDTYIANRTSPAETLADFRRRRMNEFILGVRDLTHGIEGKNHIRFGVSPFGIWQSGTPSGIVGLSSYSAQYADSRKWLNDGYVDYMLPQTYWKRQADGGSSGQDFDNLINWWGEENTMNRHVYGGLSPSWILDGDNDYSATDLLNQVTSTRAEAANGVLGNSWFRTAAFTANSGAGRDGISTSLAGGLYAEEALIPAYDWLPLSSPDATGPAAPTVTYSGNHLTGPITAHWTPQGSEDAWRYVVSSRVGAGAWTQTIVPDWQRSLVLPGIPTEVAVEAVDRLYNKGTATTVAIVSTQSAPASDVYTIFEDFESYGSGVAAMFQAPAYTTQTNTTGGSSATSTLDYNNRIDPHAGSVGTQMARIGWDWSGGYNPAVAGSGSFRLTTFNVTNRPNPRLDLTQGLGFYARSLYSDLDIAVMIRETGSAGTIGGNGGSAGNIERSVLRYRLRKSTDWQHVYFDLPNIAWQNFFSGNGALNGSYGVLESLYIFSVEGEATTANFLYLDDFYQGPAQSMMGPAAAPQGLVATGAVDQIDLTWNASPEDDVIGYNVYRSTSSTVDVTAANRVATGVATASYSDPVPSTGVEYFYLITAVKSFGGESLAGAPDSASAITGVADWSILVD